MNKYIALGGIIIFGMLEKVFTCFIVEKLGTEGELWPVTRFLMEKTGLITLLTLNFILLLLFVLISHKLWWFKAARVVSYIYLFINEAVAIYNLIGLSYLHIL